MKAYIITRDRSRWRKYKEKHGLNGSSGVDLTLQRPTTRGQCRNGLRPCPWISCRYHLYLDITQGGSIRINFPELTLEEMEHTCVLDVAEKEHGCTLERIGELMNLTRERVRQIEQDVFDYIRPNFKLHR